MQIKNALVSKTPKELVFDNQDSIMKIAQGKKCTSVQVK